MAPGALRRPAIEAVFTEPRGQRRRTKSQTGRCTVVTVDLAVAGLERGPEVSALELSHLLFVQHWPVCQTRLPDERRAPQSLSHVGGQRLEPGDTPADERHRCENDKDRAGSGVVPGSGNRLKRDAADTRHPSPRQSGVRQIVVPIGLPGVVTVDDGGGTQRKASPIDHGSDHGKPRPIPDPPRGRRVGPGAGHLIVGSPLIPERGPQHVGAICERRHEPVPQLLSVSEGGEVDQDLIERSERLSVTHGRKDKRNPVALETKFRWRHRFGSAGYCGRWTLFDGDRRFDLVPVAEQEQLDLSIDAEQIEPPLKVLDRQDPLPTHLDQHVTHLDTRL